MASWREMGAVGYKGESASFALGRRLVEVPKPDDPDVWKPIGEAILIKKKPFDERTGFEQMLNADGINPSSLPLLSCCFFENLFGGIAVLIFVRFI